MERPRITLGSPILDSPPPAATIAEVLAPPAAKRIRTAQDLLQQFSPRKTRGRPRKLPPASEQHLSMQTTRDLRIKSDTLQDRLASPMALRGNTNKLMTDDDSEDELSGISNEKLVTTYSLRRRNPPEPQSSTISKQVKSTNPVSKKIISSDLTPGTEDMPVPKQLTSRGQVRATMRDHTKAKRDAFLLAHQHYFRPLLPDGNYISKMEQSVGRDSTAIQPYLKLEEQPAGIKATMKPYQLTGLSFLNYLHSNGMPGILGDEMGLGKTLQTLSLFQHLEEQDNRRNDDGISDINRPYLVVCPLSVLNSWIAEAAKWVPSLKVLRFHGPTSEREHLKAVALGQRDRYGNETLQSKKRKLSRKSASAAAAVDDPDSEPYKLIVTTYEIFTSENQWFKKAFIWRYVVLDEGHKIKNDGSLVSKALQGMAAEYRLVLTGTPLQNNLHEMWAILHWLLPDVFNPTTAELFTQSFDLSRGKVSARVMDDSRRLLELIMLRRMKDSPGVNLGLPPKTEIVLFAPLTPMQRFWYQRLLTKSGNGLLEELFKDSKAKETKAKGADIEESKLLAALESVESKLGSGVVDWDEDESILRQALEQEATTPRNGDWRRLMNLLMQLRKCCIHPYILRGASPEPYHLGDHVIRASGKFIVLEKLIRELVISQRKKVLIFAGFIEALNCCEDLLSLLSEGESTFNFLRLEGTTSRARRNLNIRLFNDSKEEYKVMLISTRAGGLGINLASATEVIFMDQDWNPQLTLQAEARAHRIGQTRPVTVYKICSQGTVEEQMMGRISKKLYLSAKITESMQSVHGQQLKTKGRGRSSDTDDAPQLDASQLKTLIRRGAHTLSHDEIDPAQMLSWNFEQMLEHCKDKPVAPTVAAATTEEDEKEWLSTMERVESRVFGGKHHEVVETERLLLPESVCRADRRVGKNTTVMVGGFAISKESMGCADWEAIPTLAGKDPRLADPKREKRAAINHQEVCQTCFDGGELLLCSSCPRSYHVDCLNAKFKGLAKKPNFFCPQHECADCEKKTTDAGGLIYRCRWCENGFCEDCLDWDNTELLGDTLIEFETLGYPIMTQAFYISCAQCKEQMLTNAGNRKFVEQQTRYFEQQHAAWRESREDALEDAALRPPSLASSLGTPKDVTEVSTPRSEHIPRGKSTKKRKAEFVDLTMTSDAAELYA